MNTTTRIDSAQGLYLAGDIAGARRACEALLAERIGAHDAVAVRLILVECSRRSGDVPGGIAHARAAVSAVPDHALAHYALAVCLEESGDKVAAIAEVRQAIRHDADMLQAHRYLGTLLLGAGDAPGAVDSFRRATELDPNDVDHWNNLGTALRTAERLPEAEDAYRRALARGSGDARAECNLALLLRDQGRGGEAEAALRASIARQRPEHVYRPALVALADMLRMRGVLDEAAELYLRAAKLAPDASGAEMLSLGNVLAERGDLAQARKAFGAALRQNPRHLRAALAMNLTLPMIYGDAAQVLRARAEYAQGLETLERSLESLIAGLRWNQVVDGLIWSNFLLAYQGEDDTELQRRYAALVGRALDHADPGLRAPIAAAAVSGRRIRIGFVSSFLYKCTVGQYFARWLTDLDRERYEVCFYPLRADLDSVTSAIAARADRLRPLVGGDAWPSRIAPAIRDESLDILVYPELGMDQVTFCLGAMRLAPRQYAAWGHPVTTGHATIDGFFGCDAMEPPGAQAHYTEPLLLLPGIGTRFARPQLPQRAERASLGLPQDATLLLCPQSLFKIHPDNDTLFARVLAASPAARLVLFAGRHPVITDQFMRRLRACFEQFGIAIRERTYVLPHLSHEGYLAVNLACDAMLDTVRWSGGQTSVDALDCGLPVVTLPGAMMRGRQSAGMLRLIGADELIAKDIDDYVRIATRLCADPEWRLALSARIRERSSRLFDDAAPIAALDAFYREQAAKPVA
jgi:predicted O-linked N-acetylglucosamine transferase (SPINDLY family)